MYKKIAVVIGLLLLLSAPVYAHLTGAFVDYLAVVYDETTISKLQDELAETKEDIEALTSQVEQAEKTFKDNQSGAIEQLQFYSEMGLDTYLAMMQQGTDIVDIMGNQYIISTKIDAYLQDLNALYVEYQQLLTTQQTLQGHEDLLKAIDKNLAARQAFLDENAGLELEVIANYLDIDWTSEVEEPIMADFAKDAETVTSGLIDWVTQTSSLPYTLNEQWLNSQSNARYYFRGDHIYVEYELEYAHVLVLGQILQNEQGTAAELVFEAGFYNGFYLPEELLVELKGFTLDYEQLKTFKNIREPYIVQTDGALQLFSK